MARVSEGAIRVPGESIQEGAPNAELNPPLIDDTAGKEPELPLIEQPTRKARAAKNADVPRAELRACDVDITKLTGPVLTADGWVVPDMVKR